jgi:ribosomal protein S18 acetylase RimI-like enzyme
VTIWTEVVIAHMFWKRRGLVMQKEEIKAETQIRIRKAEYDDIDAMKKVLARAYDKEPVLNWVVVQDAKRTQRMERMFEVQLGGFDSIRHDHVFTAEQLNGIAIWYPPEPQDCWNPPPLKVLSLMPKLIAVHGLRRIRFVDSGIRIMIKHHLKNMKDPHYYLEVMGVEPTQQRKAIGTHLLQHGLRMCNEKGVPAYLETATEENVRFYQKNGFKVIEDFTLPKGPKVWTMIYEPK